jgi:hypothetical protein
MDFGGGAVGGQADVFANMEESQEMDSFLASLGPCSRQDLKRKSVDDSWLLSQKRCKA